MRRKKNFQRSIEKDKKDFRRLTNNRVKRVDVIIACEDSVSSPTYFRMIIKMLIEERKITQNSIVLVPHDGSTHPTGILSNLKNYKNNYGKTYRDFEHKWIVIDRDYERVDGGGHTAEDFNNAMRNAMNSRKNLNIEVAYANDSFELWYLLHFDYRTTAIMRDEILEKVVFKLKQENPHKFINLNKNSIKQEGYTKNIFDILLNKQQTAIKNAKKLLKSYGDHHNPEQDNPSTTVHNLVELLNNLDDT